MALIGKSAAALRFLSADLDEVTRVLGLGPNAYGKRPDLWLRDVPDRRPGDLDAQIAELFAPLTDDLAAWRRLAARCSGHVFCGVFGDDGNFGFSLSSETLGLLADRGIGVDFDIYDLPRSGRALK